MKWVEEELGKRVGLEEEREEREQEKHLKGGVQSRRSRRPPTRRGARDRLGEQRKRK